VIGFLALLVAVAAPPTAADGNSVAKRLVAAIKSGTEFQGSDFERPLEASDRAALHAFAACRVGNIAYALTADPTEPDTYVENRDWVMVGFGCKGVSDQTPVGITLHLHNGKIGTIETHNADLMRVR